LNLGEKKGVNVANRTGGSFGGRGGGNKKGGGGKKEFWREKGIGKNIRGVSR